MVQTAEEPNEVSNFSLIFDSEQSQQPIPELMITIWLLRQKEIENALDTIDRISKNTHFADRNL